MEEELISIIHRIPQHGVVFAFDFDLVGIFRAIGVQSRHNTAKQVLLIDNGRTIDATMILNSPMYSLSMRAQEFHWLAIPCDVVQVILLRPTDHPALTVSFFI